MIDFFEFLFNLSLAQVIFMNIGMIFINILLSLFIKSATKKKYKKTNSVEETLYFQQMLGKYLQFISTLITAFLLTLSIMPHLEWMGNLKILGALIFVYFNLFIILILNSLILHDLNKSLRKTTSTKWEDIKLLLRVLIFSVIPMIIMLVIIDTQPFKNLGSAKMQKYIKILTPMVIYILLSFIMPLFTKYMLKGKPFEEGELKDDFTAFVEKSGVKKFKLYLWATKDNKHANALVSGLLTKEIFMSDYLLENFSTEEAKGILAHEIGHIKKHHLWIRTALILGLFILGPVLGNLMELFEDNFYEIPFWLGLLILAAVMIGYLVFLKYFISRTQERQADAFALEMGIDPMVYASALYKLAKLNNSVMKFNKLDEKLQTHPSIARRIKYILEKNGLNMDEVMDKIIYNFENPTSKDVNC
ncbi:M48 family metalloprotease [Clostridium sp. MSJ-11]|uniref:M48 family metalloprotease n=1 Tax=Clostridium mobile TaxID=2841512 RepID=A0ABS6EKH9_9CLOT|nr:M48 family metallopeptidase [Clostridium mobile]MBU5485719.1 M48 family metalloprotease [Clostridium mobile]